MRRHQTKRPDTSQAFGLPYGESTSTLVKGYLEIRVSLPPPDPLAPPEAPGARTRSVLPRRATISDRDREHPQIPAPTHLGMSLCRPSATPFRAARK